MKNFRIKNLLSGLVIISILLSNATFAVGNVTPDVNESLAPGKTFEVSKSVETSEIPPKLDFVLLVDLSGSYGGDLINIRNLDDGIYDAIAAETTDLEVGVTSFIDFPLSPWGGLGDYHFQLDQDLTSSKLTWTTAIDNLILGWGNDSPESQYAGLKDTAEQVSWRPGSTRVIAITTDAGFHVPADTGGTYPGPSEADTITALNAEGIIVIAIKAPGSTSQMDDIAAITGGSVVTTGSSSAEIGDAILEGLSNIEVTVSADVSDCNELDISFDPETQTVDSGQTAVFEETITVPENTPEGTTISCTVVFNDENGNELGTQTINIEIPDLTAPTLECIPATNPAGKNIPKAGEKSKGQNEDGFYQIIATDNVDEDLEISINGIPVTTDKVKITEAKGVTPKAKIKEDYTHLILDSDAIITATDDAGNETSVSCLVPPMPK